VRAVPAAQKIGIKEGLAGLIKAEIKKLELDGNKIKNLSADLALTGGRISLSQMKAPIEKMDLSASVQNDKLSIRSFSAAVSDAVLKGSGDITNIYAKPGSTLRIEAEVKSLKQFLALLAGSKQGLDGKAGLSFNGSMSGTTWDDISQTISGSGKFSLDNGVLTDTNLLAQSLEKLSMFPGLAEKVKEFLPAQLRESLGREYTLLKPISQQFTVKDGIAAFNDLKIDTDFGNLKGAANLALKGEVNGTGMLSFSPELSGALIKAAAPMSYLADGQNIVAFPITFKISGAGSSVMPDLKYIGTRVMAQKGGELLNDLLNKGSGKEQPSGAAGGQTETQGTGDIMDNLKKLLNKEE